jgi:hypothetical protein
MATLNGDNIFGFSVQMPSQMNPTSQQLNSFFGVNGLQSLYGGLRGRVFMISGVLFGATLGDLAAAQNAWENYVNGIGYELVDTMGRAWSPVLLQPLVPQGRILVDYRGFYLPYQGGAIGL